MVLGNCSSSFCFWAAEITADVSDSIEERETADGAEFMLFMFLVGANICFDVDTKANDVDGRTRRSLAVAAAIIVAGTTFIVFIVRRCSCGRG